MVYIARELRSVNKHKKQKLKKQQRDLTLEAIYLYSEYTP